MIISESQPPNRDPWWMNIAKECPTCFRTIILERGDFAAFTHNREGFVSFLCPVCGIELWIERRNHEHI